MARLQRVSIPGIAEHIIQRGNNRQICFASDEDMETYLHWLHEYSLKYCVEIHSWVLMTNHVHLLCTPQIESGVSKLMQSLGRMYVRYFNHQYKRSGTLWEGRFKSFMVQNDRYLFELYRYIELNPVRAGMVDDPADYRWSSYRCNALGVKSELITAHQEYCALGKGHNERELAYQELFKVQVEEKMLGQIRDSVNKSLALGNERFTSQIEASTERRVTAAKRGRPRVCPDDF